MKSLANPRFSFSTNLLVLVLLLIETSFGTAQAIKQPTLTNDDVVKMVAAHVDEDKLIWMLQTQPASYSLAAEDIDLLKRQGVPEAVIEEMQGKTSALPGAASSPATQQATSSAPSGLTAATPKKAGVNRIGIVPPTVATGQIASGPAEIEALRSLLVQYLSGPSTEIVSIAALLPDQIEAEAKTKQCDYLVYNTFTCKKNAGGLGFLRNAHIVLGMIPMVGGVASAAATIATVTNTAEEVGALSSAITAKSQIGLAYRLAVTRSPAPLLSNTLTDTAQSDGQDIITPLIAQEAASIMTQLTKGSE